jgi:hypothetical protein
VDDAEVVERALVVLSAEFPALARLVHRQLDANARSAVARRSFQVLHDEKRLSLLTLLAAPEWGRNRAIVSSLQQQAEQLEHIPNASGIFGRLAECERGILLSTASEMALACLLLAQEATIEFDFPYRLQPAAGGKPKLADVDILARWPWGYVAFEVYSPVHTMTPSRHGWIDPRPTGLASRVSNKVTNKFGAPDQACEGFPSDTLKVVAVDLAYNDLAFLSVHTPLGKLPAEMQDVALGGADAVLAFTHYQQLPGHPVVVHGVLRRDSRSDRLWRALGPTPGTR